MSFRARQQKRLSVGGDRRRLLALAWQKGKRLREGGVGPEMRSPVGFTVGSLYAPRTPVKADWVGRGQRR